MISAYVYTGLNIPTKRQVIDSLNPDKFSKATDIINRVCKYFNITPDYILNQSRKREKTIARQVCMYFIKEKTTLTLKSIGAMFDGRDHSTVIYAIQTVNDLIDTDKRFAKTITAIEDLLNSITDEVEQKNHFQKYLPTVGSN